MSISKERLKAWRDRNPERRLLNAARQRSKKYGVKFTLRLEHIVIPTRCPVLGIRIHRAMRTPTTKWNSPSIDRVDPKRGYTPSNIVICSFKANWLKRDATVEELEKLARFYRKWKEKQRVQG